MIEHPDGWRTWTQNAMIQYRVTEGDMKIRFRSKDGHRGWTKPIMGGIDETIRQQLRDMSGGQPDLPPVASKPDWPAPRYAK